MYGGRFKGIKDSWAGRSLGSDREASQALLMAEDQERIANQQRLLSRKSEIEHLKLLLSQLRRMKLGRKSAKRRSTP
jgi:hypothetical protein